MSLLAVDFALQRSGLTASEKLVLIALCRKIITPSKSTKINITLESLCTLIEMPESTAKMALVELQKQEILSYEKVLKKDKQVLIIKVNVVNQAIEDHQQKQVDKAVDFRVDMFERLAVLHPRVGNKIKAWREFAALNPDEDLYFKIQQFMEKKITGDWNGGRIQSLEKFLNAREWEGVEAYKSNMPALVGKEVLIAGKASRMTSEWQLPKRLGEWAMTEFNMTRAEVLHEAEVFKDYWLARADAMAIKLNWDSTWRNWIRRSFVSRQQKTFAEKTRDFKEQRGKELFNTIASADADTLKAWGFGNESKS